MSDVGVRVAVVCYSSTFIALQYEIQLAEAVAQSGQDGITPERIDLCFSILGMCNIPLT